MKNIITTLIAISITLLSPIAVAHENNLTQNLFSGMAHPLAGIDHLFALILAGILIARLKTKQCIATGSVSLALILGAIGALVIGNQTWIQSAWVEAAILFSIPLYAFLLWIQKSAQTLSITLMSLFMTAHGWIHGIEISANNHGVNHLLGDSSFMFGLLLSCITIVSVSNVIASSIINSTDKNNYAQS